MKMIKKKKKSGTVFLVNYNTIAATATAKAAAKATAPCLPKIENSFV